MSERALKRILVLAAVIAVAYLAARMLGSGPAGDGDGGPLADLVSGLEPEGITAVTFVRQADTVRLERSDGAWTVNGFAADSGAVAGFLGTVTGSGTGGVVARNPANHARLGVTEDSAVAVTISREGAEDVTLLVGDAGPSFPSVYVRLPGQDPVHLFQGRMRSPARRSVEQWRDREIVALDTAAVGRIEVTREGSTYALVRRDSSWTVDGAAADGGEVSSLLRELSSLSGSGFAPDTASLGEPARRVVVTDREGDTLTVLSAHRGEGSTFRITAGDDPEVYEISSYRVDRLTPDPESLRESEGSGS